MKTFTIAAVAALAAVVSSPAVASEHRPIKPGATTCDNKQVKRSYRYNYSRVVDKHGNKAAGRHILSRGLRFRPQGDPWRVASTCVDLKKSTRTLKRLRTPPRYSTLVRTAVPPPVPPSGALSPGVAAGGYLQSIRQCESGGDYSTNTGNGYYGAYQFDLQTWQSVGGTGLPSDAPPAVQDEMAARLHAQRGSSPWPVCG